jgi:uncharacterized Ntn-hydrolase superfamily protein
VTYSIVARDPDTGHLGVAVQSCWFSVGSVVTWAEPGVGAVATQSIAEKAYGPRCLDGLRSGDAATALAAAIDADDLPELRQVGVVGADGSVAAHTGGLCIQPAGHVVGDTFSAQANLMANDRVWGALAEGFEAATGPLASRLLAGLDAAQAAGGDARGVMSAAILVVEGEPPELPGAGVVADLRVERSEDPLGDLRHLLEVESAFAVMNDAENELVDGRPEAALGYADEALRLLPGEENFRFIRAGALAGAGRVDEATEVVRELVAANPSWEVAIRGMADLGLVPLPEGVSLDDLFA